MLLTAALVANKGGVSKTTSAVSLAHTIAALTGRHTLLVDLDPQANATAHLGVRGDGGAALYSVLDQGAPIRDTAQRVMDLADWGDTPVPDNLWVLPSGTAIHQAKVSLAADLTKLYNLGEQLDDAALDDWIAVIDTGPDFSALTNATVLAATDIIVPTSPELADYQGSLKIYPVVDDVARKLRIDINFAGMLLTQYDARNRAAIQRQVIEAARANEMLPGRTFDSVVRRSTRVVESYGAGQPVTAFWPDASAAQDYLAVALEFLEQRCQDAKDGNPVAVVRRTLPDIYADTPVGED